MRNVSGGIRAPDIEVPLAVESGEGNPGPPAQCYLLGRSTALIVDQIHAL